MILLQSVYDVRLLHHRRSARKGTNERSKGESNARVGSALSRGTNVVDEAKANLQFLHNRLSAKDCMTVEDLISKSLGSI